MMRHLVAWAWAACVAAGAVLGTPDRAAAQDAVTTTAEQPTIRWKFESGQKLLLTQTQKVDMEMNFNGQPVEVAMNMQMNIGWNIDSVAEGKAQMTQTIDRVKLDMTFVGQSMKFDSADAENADPAGQAIGQALAPLVGAKITQSIDPRGRIDDVKMDPEVKAKMQAAGPAVGGGISEESLKQIMQQAGGLPEKAVAPGATWSETTDMSVPGSTAAMKIDSTFRGYEDKGGRKLARIETKFSLGEATAKPKANGNEQAEGPQVEIKSVEGTGTTWFDVEAGRLAESDSKVDMVMATDVGGQKVDQKVKMTSRVAVEAAK